MKVSYYFLECISVDVSKLDNQSNITHVTQSTLIVIITSLQDDSPVILMYLHISVSYLVSLDNSHSDIELLKLLVCRICWMPRYH